MEEGKTGREKKHIWGLVREIASKAEIKPTSRARQGFAAPAPGAARARMQDGAAGQLCRVALRLCWPWAMLGNGEAPSHRSSLLTSIWLLGGERKQLRSLLPTGLGYCSSESSWTQAVCSP